MNLKLQADNLFLILKQEIISIIESSLIKSFEDDGKFELVKKKSKMQGQVSFSTKNEKGFFVKFTVIF
jgi:hypothetical protein